MDRCCAGLLVVLALFVAAAAGAALYIRWLRHREGKIPSDRAVADIGYGPAPPGLPPAFLFDTPAALFCLRACMSAANRRLGADPQLPPAVEELGWAGGHAYVLRVTPPGGAPYLVVAVSGTLTYADVRLDLHDGQVGFYGAKAHQGFVRGWKRVYPDVLAVVDAHPGSPVLVAGHSLGAGVAALVAAALGTDRPGTPLALYSAATPRTGDAAFIALLSRAVPNHWHVQNRADIVPTLPPSVAPVVAGRKGKAPPVYADFDRVAFFDFQTGNLADNHHPMTYLCGVAAGLRGADNATCLARWSSPPRTVSWA